MKEKILRKETIEITTCQETICQNLNNLSVSLSALTEIDSALLDDEMDEKLKAIKINVLNAMFVLSNNLTTEQPV